MLIWTKRIAIGLVGLLLLALLVLWLLLSAPFLAKARGELTERILADKLGQTVEINDGVSVELGPVLHVTAEGLALPSSSMERQDLAEIGRLDFEIAVSDLRAGKIRLSGLRVDGAVVNLVADKDGVMSWSGGEKKPAKTSGADKQGASPLSFLAGNDIVFTNSHAIYKDARNGLDLDLMFDTLTLGRENPDAPVTIDGSGALNGEGMTLSGEFPVSDPFKVAATFDQMSLTIDGAPEQGGYGEGVTAQMVLDVAELGQLLDALKLERVLSGTGRVSASLKVSGGEARIPDLQVSVDLEGGQSLRVAGDMGKLGDKSDVTIDTKIRLYPDDNKPPPTTVRREIKLIGVDMQLIAQPNGIPKRGMVIETNGFTLDTTGEGPPPIEVSKISRTEDGKLVLGSVVLRIGPPEAHFLVLEGAISDALRLDGVKFGANLNLPTASLLAPELFQTSDVLGQLVGGFQLDGNIQKLTLSDLKASSENTDLWALNVTGSVDNALKFSDILLDIDLDVPSAAEVLGALNLEPVDAGQVDLSAKIESHGKDWSMDAEIKVAESGLGIGADLDLDDPHPTIRGKIESDLIRMEELRDVVATSIQLGKLNKLEQEAVQKGQAGPVAEAEDTDEIKPLVLSKPDEEEQDDTAGPIRNVTLLPLGRAILLSGMDLEIGIDLRKVQGEKGSSALTGDLELKNNQARLGPLKFEYGGGHFDLSGTMDLDDDPDRLNLSGSTGGWDFGKIMQALNFKKHASGTVHGSFDIHGKRTSFQDFIGTMSGSALVSMSGGSIDTQLLDIAGLGVIPWLFSPDKGPEAPIVCAVAPFHISNGKVSTKQTVVETDLVQIVVYGNVDLNRKTMEINGQPRRIGKPLSRSPWPFTAVGSFADPKIKVKDGPKRLHRSDGATTMPAQRKRCVPDILQLQ